MIRAIKHRANKLGHRCVDDKQTATRSGSLVIEYACDKFATLANQCTSKLKMYLFVADVQILTDDSKERCEVRNRLILRNIIVDTKTSTNINDAELEAE